MFDDTAIRARLSEVTGIDQVCGAADYAAATSLRDIRPGTAFVILAGEKKVDENRQPAPRATVKQSQATIGVIIATRNYSDTSGAAAAADARPLVKSVRDALMGFTPALQTFSPLEWQQGDVIDYDSSVLLWGEVFTTTYFIRSNSV